MNRKFTARSLASAVRKVISVIMLVIVLGGGTFAQIDVGAARKRHPNELVDKDGNKYPTKILSDGKLWMTSNLRVNVPGSYCYANDVKNCEKYGRLYTWESANKVCASLGKGWRLPASSEWWQLVKSYGGDSKDTVVIRKEAFKALLNTGTSGFNAVLGGGGDHEGQYARLEAHGFYWTSTESDSNSVYYYNFAKGSQALYQQDGGEKTETLSVRCVKDVAR